MSSKVAYTNIYDQLGTIEKNYFVQSCCPKCTHGSVLAYWCNRRNRVRGPQYPRRGNPILVTPDFVDFLPVDINFAQYDSVVCWSLMCVIFLINDVPFYFNAALSPGSPTAGMAAPYDS